MGPDIQEPSFADQKSRFLTVKEFQIAMLIGSGQTTKEIVSVLGGSIETVRTHRKAICRKLNVHSTAELVRSCSEFLTASSGLSK